MLLIDFSLNFLSRGIKIRIVSFLYLISGISYSGLAQLVEQWTVNPWVAGSSPASGAIFGYFP